MENYCRKISCFLYSKRFIEKSSIEDLRFLIELILTQIITIVTVYLIGLLFMNAVDILIICLFFVVGRKYLDGYHASNFRNCYILTILNFIFSLIMNVIILKIEFFYILGVILSIYLLIKYHYKKIIIFNFLYLVTTLLFTGIVHRVNMVNYFTIILMRIIGGKELQ